LLLSGTAPISPHILDFLKATFGQVCEGYGQTETTAGSSMTLANDFESGTVGAPLPSNEITLVNVPEMNYFAAENNGEICFRGPNCFIGYYKEDSKTKETIDKDGWVHSGDIGKWDEKGRLVIIDRKKE
jgi:long-chain acyl-CoA synthetase